MREVPATKVRDILGELLSEVIYRGEEVMILRRGRPVAKLVPVADSRRGAQGGAAAIEADPLYQLIGAGNGIGRTDAARELDEVVYGR